MSDVLLEIAKRPLARRAVRAMGLPLPMPEPLRRAKGPWRADELAGRDVVVAPRGPLAAWIEEVLRGAGAHVHPGAGDAALHAVVVDASGVETVEGLREVYAALQARVGRIAKSGRVIVVGRPAAGAPTPSIAAARAALEGFVRSVAKEIGRRGATANLLLVEPEAEERAGAPLRFLASDRSAFVSAQPIVVDRRAAPLGTRADVVRSLAGKVALVTGAARGIGAATVRLLADEGAHVVCLDRPADREELEAVAREVGGSALGIDVTDADAPARIAEALRDRHGGLDVVVHNAGITRDRTLAKMPEALWNQVIDVNLAAPIRIDQALLRGVLRDGGRVILLSSIAGIAGNVGQTNYAASKGGLAGYARALAAVLAPRGVTVNAIAPGFVETRLTAAIPLVIREAGRRLAALGQGGLPEDVGHAIAFLATPHAQGITGQVLRVCGGAFVGA